MEEVNRESNYTEGPIRGLDLPSDKALMMECFMKITPDIDSLSSDSKEALDKCHELSRTLMEISHVVSKETHSPLEEGEECNFEDHTRLDKLNKKVNLMFSLLIEFQRRMVVRVLEAKKKSREERKKVDELDYKRQKLEYHRNYLRTLITEFNQRETDYQKLGLKSISNLPQYSSELTYEDHNLIKQKLQEDLCCIKSNLEIAQQLSKKKSQFLLDKCVQMVDLAKIKKELDSIYKSISSLKEIVKPKQNTDMTINPTAECLPYPLFTLYISLLGCKFELSFDVSIHIIEQQEMDERTELEKHSGAISQTNILNHHPKELASATTQSSTFNIPIMNANSDPNSVTNVPYKYNPYQKHPLKLKLLIESDDTKSFSLTISYLVHLDTVVLETPESKNLKCITAFSVPAGIFPNDNGMSHPNPSALSIIASSGMKTNQPFLEINGAFFYWLQRICGLGYISHTSTTIPSISVNFADTELSSVIGSNGLNYSSLILVLKMLNLRHSLLTQVQEWIDELECRVNEANKINNIEGCKILINSLDICAPNIPSDLSFKISQSNICNVEYDPNTTISHSISLDIVSTQFQFSILISIPPNFPDRPLELNLAEDYSLNSFLLEHIQSLLSLENRYTFEVEPKDTSPLRAIVYKLSKLVDAVINIQSTECEL